MKFLFDNNLPPALAHGIAQLSALETDVEKVIHLKDRFKANAADAEWLGELAGEGGWVVISCDHFKKSRAEKELVRQRGLTVFVLDPQWARHGHWERAAQLVKWWPKILDVARLTSKTAMRVPWNFTSKSTFEQIRA